MRVLALTVALAALATSASAAFDWAEVTNMSVKQVGDATYYGQDPDQDAKGACSFNENFANTMSTSAWTTGTMVTIAMNHDQFNGGKGCGTCIMYRGIGGGVGVTPPSTTQWTMGIVNNQCPECHKGDIDQNINGDGRWRVEWFAVPCNVGDSKIKYTPITNLGPEYWAFVVSNTRVPVKDVQIKVDGAWHSPHYTTNNQWVWPGESVNRRWEATDFPMPVRVTSVTGEVIEDTIPVGGGDGAMQFAPVGDLVFESQIMPGYGKRANNYAEFVHPAVPKGFSLWEPETPKSAIGTEANSGVIYKTDTIYIEDGEQCGGLGGECEPRDVGQPTMPCIAAQWPLAVCASKDSICLPREAEGNHGHEKDSLIFRCGPKNYGRATDAGPGISSGGSAASKPADAAPKTADAAPKTADAAPKTAAAAPEPASKPTTEASGKSGTPDVATGGRKLLFV
jgi:hypothetical protein